MAMKHQTKLALAALTLVLTACGDLLTETPRSIITTENFYASEADALAALAAIYTSMNGQTVTGIYFLSNNAGDDNYNTPLEENPNHIATGTGHWDSRNPHFNSHWNAAYLMITRANLLLEKLDGLSMDQGRKAAIAAETRFLRAYAYFTLVRSFGDVPLVVTTEDQRGDGARTPKAEVFAQIIKDATEAEADLLLTHPAATRGRATKNSARALLANVYIWRSSAENSNEWEQAAAAAKRVIDSGVNSLEPNWINAFLPGSQNSAESVYLHLACAATGCPAINIAGWIWPRELEASGTGGWAESIPTPHLLASFPEGDYRAVTGSAVNLAGPNGVGYFTSGRHLNGSIRTFVPHVYKFRPSTRPGPQDANWPVYRYAEVLLFYAEAVNELNRPGEAIEYVNLIRARARNGTGNENRPQPANLPVMSQSATREAIFNERRLELAHESKRYFDMVRRGEEYFLAALDNDPTILFRSTRNMIWPIPQAQIDVNPNLVQNPGF
jgi:starch-binding outer membrane protein, SusD/RagB family